MLLYVFTCWSVTATKTTIQKMTPTIPMKPRTMPATAMPRPVWWPPLRSICFLEMKPKMRARIQPKPLIHKIPRTIDAMARPLVV